MSLLPPLPGTKQTVASKARGAIFNTRSPYMRVALSNKQVYNTNNYNAATPVRVYKVAACAGHVNMVTRILPYCLCYKLSRP